MRPTRPSRRRRRPAPRTPPRRAPSGCCGPSRPPPRPRASRRQLSRKNTPCTCPLHDDVPPGRVARPPRVGRHGASSASTSCGRRIDRGVRVGVDGADLGVEVQVDERLGHPLLGEPGRGRRGSRPSRRTAAAVRSPAGDPASRRRDVPAPRRGRRSASRPGRARPRGPRPGRSRSTSPMERRSCPLLLIQPSAIRPARRSAASRSRRAAAVGAVAAPASGSTRTSRRSPAGPSWVTTSWVQIASRVAQELLGQRPAPAGARRGRGELLRAPSPGRARGPAGRATPLSRVVAILASSSGEYHG